MSKIEDALNKKKDNANKALPKSNLSKSNLDKKSKIQESLEVTPDHKKKQNLVVSTEMSSVLVNRRSSVKEIAKMKQRNLIKSDDLAELKIINSSMDDIQLANTYRNLRTKLLQSSKGKNFIAMVTSVVQDIHSSNTLLNIATAFSLDEGKTSLLLDCNINNPQLDYMLNMEDSLGITNYLEDERINIETIVHESGIKRLRVIPAGTQRETAIEYFTSLRMKNLTASLLNRYSDRYIFIDSPPVIGSADTKILAELCDFVILVVPYGTASINRIRDAANAIGKDKLLGVIFSEIPKLPSSSTPQSS
ncbi:hypothetical protein MNBD_GAMMA07-1701 [hydrothermal vent metagenome]|uniref:Uncharacterized protein n=1 Tax=hydrothermal vent metagenome TaxID=652676 RepID=A0A3B0X241_9ZZZZ